MCIPPGSNPRKVRQLTIIGDHKMAVWDDMNNLEPIRYYDKGVTADHYSSFGEFQMILRDGQITIPRVKMFEPLLLQDTEFIHCVVNRRAPSRTRASAWGSCWRWRRRSSPCRITAARPKWLWYAPGA
ncbi:MAG: hypothetical protein PHQ04_07755 [Opitutaceae bacterium]|nr:hypothetical protein [Opitutaceae bacterium]